MGPFDNVFKNAMLQYLICINTILLQNEEKEKRRKKLNMTNK
jgi:hypothetical protein